MNQSSSALIASIVGFALGALSGFLFVVQHHAAWSLDKFVALVVAFGLAGGVTGFLLVRYRQSRQDLDDFAEDFDLIPDAGWGDD